MKNYRLSPAEQETIINWDNELETASVYTYDQKLGKRLLELSRKYPGLFVLKEKGSQHCLMFTVPKKYISIRQPYSEERKKKQSMAAKERVKKYGSPFEKAEETI
jgi:hypothetical protein